MKFNIWIVLSFLSTGLSFINTPFFSKTQILPTCEFSKSVIFSQHNDINVNNRVDRFKKEAVKLRQEAEEIEIALREEARAKGVPEEMINKLIPITRQRSQSASKTSSKSKEKNTELTANTIRSKLGYLNTGDAIRMTSELERIKSNDIISKWNSINVEDSRFMVSIYQLKAKTNIVPANLKLDDVGFAYQNVLGVAVIIGTLCGLSANAVGGELGFLLGYASALFPVILVGIGSIAPGLIGEALYRCKLVTNEEARKRDIRKNAGKFLAGYICGLPVAKFSQGNPSNTAEFFQLRPSDVSGTGKVQDKRFKQIDIARISIVCLAGSVAECIDFGVASGSNPGDVNLLNELINSVEPRITPDQVQNHIRWSALTAWEILDQYKEEYQRLVVAFEKGLPMEECIAVIEGEGEV
uniref:Uncharacterized protein n=1 Tax=viral metagenome TaxID=1070528 RepID=A0A6C0EG66_9ZZZZ